MATILDLPEIRVRVHRWTVAQYVKLEDDPAFRRCELIRGIIIDKKRKTPLDSYLIKKNYDFFQRDVVAGLTVRQGAPLRLADSVPEPDVAVVQGTSKDFGIQHPVVAELVAEVTTSSVVLDRECASLYAEAGIKEHWIILGVAGQIEVYRQPENGVYQKKRVYSRAQVIEGVSVTGKAVPVDTFLA